jgi:hypothetical protein
LSLPKRTTEGSFDTWLTEIEYATAKTMAIEISQAPESRHPNQSTGVAERALKIPDVLLFLLAF